MKAALERHQVWLYLAAILAGMVTGWLWPSVTGAFEVLLWPGLGILLYATFTQIPLTHLATAFRDGRFNLALVLGNFVIMPIVVWLLLLLAPADPAIRLGLLLVLLVPCTDWFISFTHLGGGDSARAIAASPILLILQIILLPLYLWLFLGKEMVSADLTGHLLPVFFGLILTPLLLAWLTEKAGEKKPAVKGYIEVLGWLPVPLLALVVFLIAASQITLVLETGRILPMLAVIFTIYLVAAALVGKLLSHAFALPGAKGQTLAFSFGTRNSFVVLPFAIALPELWSLAIVVIVFQSLVELFGMTAYLKWLPGLFREKS
ncbi:arsenic resistance protein [Marinobacter halophilus]|uniref:Bile acid:sodium symporter n=1 Tax=Marinobacter halophilus TaxID=1323740 RepID=A0A2T1KFE3_9GAMM|nr:bile acid:sodium symporter [Marinobacter halophilus]PSF08846.1 bile acid:sodium symporter [Marinobacter halophilus]GGC64395.1 arsenic resistance protein [Marinobacter halophilus]